MGNYTTRYLANYMKQKQIATSEISSRLNIPEKKLLYDSEEMLTAEEFLKLCVYLQIKPEDIMQSMEYDTVEMIPMGYDVIRVIIDNRYLKKFGVTVDTIEKCEPYPAKVLDVIYDLLEKQFSLRFQRSIGTYKMVRVEDKIILDMKGKGL